MDIPVNRDVLRPASRRIRRTPAHARQLILDAAEACMGAAGPAGLRLTRVAAEAGVSHPTLLHHFGSRDALITAVHRRAVESMRDRLSAMLHAGGGSRSVVQAVFAAYRDGIAERLVWMLQSGVTMSEPGDGTPMLAGMVDGLHALRRQIAPPGLEPDRGDTQRIIHLIAVAAFGDALIGPRLRIGAEGRPGHDDNARLSHDDDAQRGAFEAWFSDLVDRCVAPWAGAP